MRVYRLRVLLCRECHVLNLRRAAKLGVLRVILILDPSFIKLVFFIGVRASTKLVRHFSLGVKLRRKKLEP